MLGAKDAVMRMENVLPRQSIGDDWTDRERAYRTMPELKKARKQYLTGGALMTLAALFAVFVMSLYPAAWMVSIGMYLIGFRAVQLASNNEDKGKEKLRTSTTGTN